MVEVVNATNVYRNRDDFGRDIYTGYFGVAADEVYRSVTAIRACEKGSFTRIPMFSLRDIAFHILAEIDSERVCVIGSRHKLRLDLSNFLLDGMIKKDILRISKHRFKVERFNLNDEEIMELGEWYRRLSR